MAITRRRFLKCSGVAGAGALLGPSLFANPLVRNALASTLGDRYLVVLYLDGGNDGLNTVVPMVDDSATLRADYEAARFGGIGGIRLTPDDLAATAIGLDFDTETQLALHPGFAGFPGLPGAGGLKALYDLGKVAVMQGCGYPEYSLSHDASRVIWQTADPLALVNVEHGWVGRFLAANYGGTEIPAYVVNRQVPGELKQATTSVLAVPRLRDFGFPYDDFNPLDDGAKRAAFLAVHDTAGLAAHSALSFVGDNGAATLRSSESYPALHDLYEAERSGWSQQYEAIGRRTADDLREVAKVIYGVTQAVPNVHARLFRVSNEGYDTHSNQGGATGLHFDLHAEVASALKVFYDDCADMGVADKVTVVVWSEFSRRIQQNSNGTDHGSQGPMFVVGGTVNGGVYGKHPNIDVLALDGEGNTPYTQVAGAFRSTDFRDVYGTILKHWLGMPHATILGDVLPYDTGDEVTPATHWTAENFDLTNPANGQPLFLP
jgi:uncharacterized protein (DUF1501 family)